MGRNPLNVFAKAFFHFSAPFKLFERKEVDLSLPPLRKQGVARIAPLEIISTGKDNNLSDRAAV